MKNQINFFFIENQVQCRETKIKLLELIEFLDDQVWEKQFLLGSSAFQQYVTLIKANQLLFVF